MGVLDGDGDRQRERGSFVGEFGASHCNQWGLCDTLFSNYFEDLFRYVSRQTDKYIVMLIALLLGRGGKVVSFCSSSHIFTHIL